MAAVPSQAKGILARCPERSTRTQDWKVVWGNFCFNLAVSSVASCFKRQHPHDVGRKRVDAMFGKGRFLFVLRPWSNTARSLDLIRLLSALWAPSRSEDLTAAGLTPNHLEQGTGGRALIDAGS